MHCKCEHKKEDWPASSSLNGDDAQKGYKKTVQDIIFRIMSRGIKGI